MNEGYALKQNKDERGVVSLITVIFFMVFISLIAMSFMTIVIADQRQVIDNDLSASALAAARSGVEDGKRILLYCQANPGVPGCSSALSSQDDCTVFSPGIGPAQAVATALDIDINADGEGVTGNATDYKQYFTCLTIQEDTSSLSASIGSGSDFIQRLDTASPFDRLTISWSGTGAYIDRSSAVGGWPILSEWKSGTSPYIPVVRFQIIPYSTSSGSFDLNTIEASSRTVFIVPCGSGAPSCTPSGGDANALDFRAALTPAVAGGTSGLRDATSSPPIAYSQCTTSPSDYTCTISLTGFDLTGNTRYYARVSSIYGSTGVTITPSSGGVSVNFDGVQPWIDVTGRTNDVFKRVRAQVSYQPTIPLPVNALSSAAPICKKINVTNDTTTTSYNCP